MTVLRGRLRSLRTKLTPGVELPGPNRLRWTNRLARRRVGGGPGPIVSLTTYGDRIETAYLAIESIARGSLSPSRLILWLDDEQAFHRPPASLRRLVRRGLDMRLSENFGPHTKYFPFIEESASFDAPLATADDDTIYPRTWLERLATEHARTPREIVCYRSRRARFDGTTVAPYRTWELSEGADPAYTNLFTAVSGIIYPPEVLRALKERGRAFVDCTPANDDFWIHHTAMRIGIPARVIDGVSRTFPLIDPDEGDALWHSNLTEGRNDVQFSATYTDTDISVLFSEHTNGTV